MLSSEHKSATSSLAPPKFAVVIIDFDQTVTGVHTYGVIWDAIESKKIAPEKQAIIKLMNTLPSRGNPDDWKRVIEELIVEGHDVSICTFSNLGFAIEAYFRDTIKLSPESMAKVHINSWLPEEIAQKNSGKDEHIKQSNKHFGNENLARPNILVEDSKANIDRALASKLLERDNAIFVPTTTQDRKGGYPTSKREYPIFGSAGHIDELRTKARLLKAKMLASGQIVAVSLVSQNPADLPDAVPPLASTTARLMSVKTSVDNSAQMSSTSLGLSGSRFPASTTLSSTPDAAPLVAASNSSHSVKPSSADPLAIYGLYTGNVSLESTQRPVDNANTAGFTGKKPGNN